MKIMFVQTGNYAQAYRRLASGAPETYRDQNASVSYVADLAPAHDVLTVSFGDTPHDDTLALGLRSIELPRNTVKTGIASLLDSHQPDRLILRSPFHVILKQAGARGIPTLPCFADLFQSGGPRSQLRHARLRLALRRARTPCVANHSLNASRSVNRVLGIPQAGVVPWDWSPITPNATAKEGIIQANAPRLFYAGALSADKGVGDCLKALQILKARGLTAQISLAGGGDISAWQKMADQLGIAEQVHFLGLIPNTDVRMQMTAHDIVLVPSRHSYPEGLPNTIYEALASRSPLVLSDHPAFAGRVTHGNGCLSFKGADPASLADAISNLSTDAALYAALSKSAPETLSGLYIGLEWSELVTLFLEDPEDHSGWVSSHALPALGF